jgi:MFS family permease
MKTIRYLKRPKIIYEYWIVAAAFLCLFIGSGTTYFGFSLFVGPLQTEFGWSRGGIMIAFTLTMLISGVISPLMGRLIDRYGAGKVIAAGALISGLGFILLNKASNFPSFYIGWSIVGVGGAASGIVPATMVVSNWFKEHRGTAIGITTTGMGAGGVILAPLIGSYLIPGVGWRTSYFVMAIITWLIIPLAFSMRTRPANTGLNPGAIKVETATKNRAMSPSPGDFSLRMALSTSAFWLISIAFMTSGFAYTGAFQNQGPYLQDIGFPAATAATVISSASISILIGRFFFGWLCDKIKPKYACCIGFVLQLGAILVLYSVQPGSQAAVWLYTVLMGLGMGSWLPTMSMLTSSIFGLASYAVIFGMIGLGNTIGAAIGPAIVGYIYDSTHTYHQAFIILASLYAVAIPTILLVRQKSKQGNS